jgi:hypothetical protein
MKTSRILPVVGILTLLLPCGAVFTQSPNQIPPGAGIASEKSSHVGLAEA